MRRFTIITALALSVSACGGSSAEITTTTATTAADTSTSLATTTTAAPETTTTTAATATTTTIAATGGGADCVAGEWDLDSEAFVEQLDAAFGSAAGGDFEVSSNGGEYVIEFAADGTMSSQRTDWGMTMATEQGDIVLTFDGSESGTWAAAGDTLTVSISESDVSVDFSLLVDGELVSLPGGTEAMFSTDAATVSGSGTYRCEGDTLTLDTTDDETGTEISSVLRRR